MWTYYYGLLNSEVVSTKYFYKQFSQIFSLSSSKNVYKMTLLYTLNYLKDVGKSSFVSYYSGYIYFFIIDFYRKPQLLLNQDLYFFENE